MIKQGGKINRLSTTLKLLGRHFDLFDKNNSTSPEFIESLQD